MDVLYQFWCRKSTISGNAKEVFTILWGLAGFGPGIIEGLTLMQLAVQTGFSVDALDGRLKTLEEAGLIERESIERGLFRFYVYHPLPEKREETKPQKIVKPTPLFDLLKPEHDFYLPSFRENDGENHGENDGENHDIEKRQPNTPSRRELQTKSPPKPVAPSGGKRKQEYIKVNKENVFALSRKNGDQKTTNRKTVDDLLKKCDLNDSTYLACREKLELLVREKDISPDLIDRIAAGIVLNLPGFDSAAITDIRNEAKERQKAGLIKARYVHIAKYAQEVFEANGYVWTSVRNARRARIENQLAGVR